MISGAAGKICNSTFETVIANRNSVALSHNGTSAESNAPICTSLNFRTGANRNSVSCSHIGARAKCKSGNRSGFHAGRAPKGNGVPGECASECTQGDPSFGID